MLSGKSNTTTMIEVHVPSKILKLAPQCHHNLDELVQAYIKVAQIAADAKGYLFRTALSRTRRLSEHLCTRRMITA